MKDRKKNHFERKLLARSLFILTSTICVFSTAQSATAADMAGKGPAVPAAEAPTVPGGDIFGFTSGTDVGAVGDKAMAFEFSGRAGKRGGDYFSVTDKNQFSATVAPNLAIAASVFATYHSINNVPAIADRNAVAFDGVSAEVAYRVLERGTIALPIAITLSAEPRWGRVDGLTGDQVQAGGVEGKIFIDAVVVPDKMFIAFNANYGISKQQTQTPPKAWAPAAGTNLSTALTFAATDKLFVGGEVRYLRSYGSWDMKNFLGHALFTGPTMLYKITDKTTFNAVWTPQVWGKAQGVAQDFDLDNFERHQFRAKIVSAF